MTAQLALDIRLPARRTDPSTSRMSAIELMESGQLNDQCGAVLACLRVYPNRTSAELARDTGLDRYMAARRLPDLREAGYARMVGKRRCGVTGKMAMA